MKLYIILLSFLYLGFNHVSTDDAPCVTKGCLITADLILENMDATEDPCKNFYKFACKKFAERTIVSESRPVMDMYHIRRYQLWAELKTLLERPKVYDEPEAFWKARDYFASCMDGDRKLGLPALTELLDSMGGFPLSQELEWNEYRYDWKNATTLLLSKGFNDGIWKVSVVPTSTNPDADEDEKVNVLQLEFNILNYGHIESKYNLREAIGGVAQQLGAISSVTDKEIEQIRDVVAFIEKLNNDTILREGHGEINLATIADTQKLIPQVDWQHLVSRILKRHVEPTETILISNPDGFVHLISILDNAPKRVVANYLSLSALVGMQQYLPIDVMSSVNELVSELGGEINHDTRTMQCLYHMKDFVYAGAAMYARRYFTPEDKQAVQELNEQVQESLKKTLSLVIQFVEQKRLEDQIRGLGILLSLAAEGKLPEEESEIIEKIEEVKEKLYGERMAITDRPGWLEEVREKIRKFEAAAMKFQSMKTYVGFPDEFFDDQVLDDHYRCVSINRQDFFSNSLEIKSLLLKDDFKKLGKAFTDTYWNTLLPKLPEHVLLYNEKYNNLEIPAHMMRTIFYSHDRPAYLNFGSLGFHIARKLSDLLFKFIIDFDMNEETWPISLRDELSLERERLLRYVKTAQPDIPLPDFLNSTDFAIEVREYVEGIKLAYSAYDKWAVQHEAEISLPGLDNFTSKQMFWLSYATTQCRTEQRVYERRHEPIRREWVVNAALPWVEGFKTDFNCPASSDD